MVPVFGDFLTPAGEHITAAVAFRGELPDGTREDAIAELGRVVSALARYFGDLPPPDDPGPGEACPLTFQEQAAADARVALRRAAAAWATVPRAPRRPILWSGTCQPPPTT